MGERSDYPDAYGPEDANVVVDVRGILAALHQSGHTVSIRWNGSGSIELTFGDPERGDLAVTRAKDEVLTIAEAALWLRDQACRHYPDSRFARRYRNQIERSGSCFTPGSEWAGGCTCPTGQGAVLDGTYRVDPKCPAHGFA
jgi:hypothetical protein